MTPWTTDRAATNRIFESLGKLEAGQAAIASDQTQQLAESGRQHLEINIRLRALEGQNAELTQNIKELMQLRSWAFRMLLALAGIGLTVLASTKHGWDVIVKLLASSSGPSP